MSLCLATYSLHVVNSGTMSQETFPTVTVSATHYIHAQGPADGSCYSGVWQGGELVEGTYGEDGKCARTTGYLTAGTCRHYTYLYNYTSGTGKGLLTHDPTVGISSCSGGGGS